MSKVISGKDALNAKPWHIPDVDTLSADDPVVFTSNEQASQDAPGESDKKRGQEEFNQGYNEGFERGFSDGTRAASEQLAQDRSALLKLMEFLVRPVHNLEQQVEHELLELTLAVAKQILKREIAIKPEHIVGLIRTSVARLPVAETKVTVQLHPSDAKVVRQVISGSESEQRWRIVEDPGLNPGSCHVNSESSFVDGGIDAMVAQTAINMFGGQRGADSRNTPKAEPVDAYDADDFIPASREAVAPAQRKAPAPAAAVKPVQPRQTATPTARHAAEKTAPAKPAQPRPAQAAAKPKPAAPAKPDIDHE